MALCRGASLCLLKTVYTAWRGELTTSRQQPVIQELMDKNTVLKQKNDEGALQVRTSKSVLRLKVTVAAWLLREFRAERRQRRILQEG